MSAKFSRALDRGHYRSAYMLAFEVRRVSLSQALQLTLLAAEHEPERFESMSRRWIARLLEEVPVPLGDLATIAILLEDVKAGRLPALQALEPGKRVVKGLPLG